MNTHPMFSAQHEQRTSYGPSGQPTNHQCHWWHAHWVGYASNLLLVAGAVLLGWLDMLIDLHDYFIGTLFVIGTFLVSWVWGRGPALLALAIGIVSIDYLAIPPNHTFSFSIWPGLVSLVPFIGVQLLLLWLIGRQKTYQSQLQLARGATLHYAEQVAASNQELEKSNARLEQANAIKDQFLATAAHELRTPVTSISGYIQLVLRRLDRQGPLNPELVAIRASLVKVYEHIRQLVRLMNVLFDVNSLRAGKVPLHLEPCDLRSLCREVVEAQRFVTGRSIGWLEPADPVLVHVDEKRLFQVVLNLVTNALTYSVAETMIHVEIGQNMGEALLVVRNHGLWVPQEQQEALFEPFYRPPGVQSSVIPGWGLGLAISKGIVLQHGGRIWMESSEEKDTISFCVALPLATARQLA